VTFIYLERKLHGCVIPQNNCSEYIKASSFSQLGFRDIKWYNCRLYSCKVRNHHSEML